jgi:hypothetical protein
MIFSVLCGFNHITVRWADKADTRSAAQCRYSPKPQRDDSLFQTTPYDLTRTERRGNEIK